MVKYRRHNDDYRAESIVVQLRVPVNDNNIDNIRELTPSGTLADTGDIVNLSYEFNVQYYGRVVSRLRALIDLLNEPDVTDVSFKSNLGTCVASDFFVKLSDVMRDLSLKASSLVDGDDNS